MDPGFVLNRQRVSAKEFTMLGSVNQSLQDQAVLTRAVEGVFRKLIRFLVGKISLVMLQQMIRTIFVEEAEDHLRRENPARNISLTKIALLSGLDTRTLTRIRNSEYYRRPFHEGHSFLRELTPASSLLDVWTTRTPYMDADSGEPRPLALHGGEDSFESLCAEVVRGRGVTPQSMLGRMLASGAISLDENSGTVRVVSHTYLPGGGQDELGATEMGFSAVSNLIDTVAHNIATAGNDDQRLFQRGVWTFRLAPENRQRLRAEARRFLTRVDEEAQSRMLTYEEPQPRTDQITAGISLFYFEEEHR
jgi:hypothetical protein